MQKRKVTILWLETPTLLPENKIHAHAADFNDVAIVKPRGTGYGSTVHGRSFVARADVVAIVALADLRGHLRLEPAGQSHRCHRGFADGGEFFRKGGFLAGRFSPQDDHRRNLEAGPCATCAPTQSLGR